MTRKTDTFQFYIGGLLRLVSNEVSQSFTRKMAEKGVSAGEWMVLRTLYETDLTTPRDVADYTGLTRGAISKLVQKLTEKKLVTRAETQNDRRYQEIYLTSTVK